MGTMAYEVGSNVDGEILLYCACPAAVLLGPIAGILSVRYLKVEGGFAGFISFLAGLVVGSFLSFVGLVGRSES